MKKLLLVGAVAIFGAANAQIDKGTMFISGNIGYEGKQTTESDKSNSDVAKVNTFSIAPTFGYFIAPNVALGLGLGYTNSVSEPGANFDFDKETISTFTIEPMVRKYWNISETFYLFGQLSVPMAFGNFTGEEKNMADVKGSVNSFGVVIKPGIDYVIAPNWTIEATVGEFGYRNTTIKPDHNPNDIKSKTENYNFGLNLGSVAFGVKYLFK